MMGFWAGTACLLLIAIVMLTLPLARERSARTRSVYMIIAAVPICAAAIYFVVRGVPEESPMQTGNASADIDDLVATLADRLARNPDEIAGWELLGRSYFALGRYGDASAAYAEAWQRTAEPTNTLKLAYAEAELLARRDAVTGLAGQLIEQVLADEPENPRALMYGGLAAEIRGQADVARDRWQLLVTLNPPEPIAAVVRERLAALDEASPVTPGLASSLPGHVELSVRVSIASDIDSTAVKQAQAMYLMARTTAGGAPIAVIRRPASSVPGEFVLTDSDRMVPDRPLTDYTDLVVIGRLSLSGEASPRPGDIYGEMPIGKPMGETVDLVLNRVVQ
jgi:cytochrome c-type biogenesis protein CcmH